MPSEQVQAVRPLSLMIVAVCALNWQRSPAHAHEHEQQPASCRDLFFTALPSRACGQQHAPSHAPCPAVRTCGRLAPPLGDDSLQHCQPSPAHLDVPARHRHRPQMHWQQPASLFTAPVMGTDVPDMWCMPCRVGCGGAGQEGQSPVGRASTWVLGGASYCLPVSMHS